MIDGYFHAAEGKIRADTTGHAVALMAPDIPWQIPYIIGDCFQNLRSSLDYLARELCIASGNHPADHTSFPVCLDPKCFGNKITERSLIGISVSARAEIERLQPYHTGNDASRSNLWLLHELCNINKHRRIYVTLLQVFENPLRTWRKQNALEPPISENVNVHHDIMADVAFHEGIISERALPFVDYMLTFVEKMIFAPFEKFF
jgi:hypothetical protein